MAKLAPSASRMAFSELACPAMRGARSMDAHANTYAEADIRVSLAQFGGGPKMRLRHVHQRKHIRSLVHRARAGAAELSGQRHQAAVGIVERLQVAREDRDETPVALRVRLRALR